MRHKDFIFVTLDDLEYTYEVDFYIHTFERKYLQNVGHYLTLTII